MTAGNMALRVAITGASGTIGTQLVPRLEAAGFQLVLLGRDPARLAAQFPGRETAALSDLHHLSGVAAVVHLAALNTSSSGDETAFRQVNVGLTHDLLAQSRTAGIARFIHLSSLHALRDELTTPYAVSKREAAALLRADGGTGIVIAHAAAVHGEQLSGRLGVITRIPRQLRAPALSLARALRPTLSVDRLAAEIVARVTTPPAPLAEIILTDGQDDNPAYHRIKRGGDIAASLLIALLAGWAMALAWIAVRAGSPGPGFFWQDRVGRNGRVFRCVKMRTMANGTRNAGSHEIGTAAITPVGRYLRASKLDELPQIWNVLRGQMSLVGPRPCLPSQSDVIAARDRHGVSAMLPGITGLSQISGIDMSTPEVLAQMDARYRALQCLSEDLRIIRDTALGRGRGDAAARRGARG